MKKKNLSALALACLCLVGTMDAQRGKVAQNSFNKPTPPEEDGGGFENSAPELDANSAGAGLVLLAGGALIVLGRRRKALA